MLLEHAPEFLTKNKIDNMGGKNTGLDRLLDSTAKGTDEVPDSLGDDE
jgi:hypothetical protein